ncbi:hypothetical protein X975_23201, partial [Stegodyphus mimosarum]
MKLAWMFCLLLAGKLSLATPGEERAAAEANLGSGYMMAFPMNDDQVAEESAQEAVKILAESLVSDDNDDDDDDDDEPADEQEKKSDDTTAEDVKTEQTEQPEPMGILQAELAAEEAEKPALPQRPFFKRPKIEELRKILGFPPPEGPAAKSKPIPQEKPKVFQSMFNKPKPKIEQSPLGGLQFNLRREDRLRPFGFPMLPLKRDDSFRPFGFPDLVQAASSILRRAILDDNNENDISKDDKEEEQNINETGPEENEEEEEDEDSLMIVPIPEPKEVTIERPPLFRRFPIPFPFPVPKPMPQSRPRLPFPPLTPVAFFLPIAQQIMQNIRHAQPRSQPPMVPLSHMHPMQNLIPIQTQIPIVPIHHPMQMQQTQQQQQMIPLHHPMIPVQQPIQQIVPFFPVPQAAFHVPILTPLPPNMQRPMMRQMPRRMPMHAPPPPQVPRRLPFPSPISRMAGHQPHHPLQPQIVNPMVRRPMQASPNTRPMPRVVRPPMPPVHPVFFMMAPMPVPNIHVPIAQAQQQVPVYHRPQNVPFLPQHMTLIPQQRQHLQPMQTSEEERVIFLRPEQEDQDDDQEVLILVPSDEVEVAQRPPVMPPQFMRQVPTPVISPLQRIKLLRDLLMARQANRQTMSPQSRASRVVEIVQQQLRIFPAHHPQAHPPQPQRADSSELHPVYVPYPGAQ